MGAATAVSPPYATRAGSRFPAGASAGADGVNFRIFSRHATRVELLLYAAADSSAPFQVVALNPETHRSNFFWHVFVAGLPAGTHYTWRMDGSNNTALSGRHFYPDRELLDPLAQAVSDTRWDRQRACDPSTAGATGLRAVVVEPLAPTDTAPQPRRAHADLEGAMIYEMHVGGFTRHPSSGAAHPGSFTALREKIPYLRDLGVTHVELLPVMAFDTQDVPAKVSACGLSNYWGYCTHSFWAPHPRYCLDPARANREFRGLVDALHEAGIGVTLDVVFNHTAEGHAGGR